MEVPGDHIAYVVRARVSQSAAVLPSGLMNCQAASQIDLPASGKLLSGNPAGQNGKRPRW